MTLRLPLNDRFNTNQVKLLDALRELSEKEVYLFVQDGEPHNEYIKSRLPDHVQLQEVNDLHAKAVVSDAFVYMGSANITRGGLTLNIELCTILENEYDSAFDYIDAELDLATH